MSLMDEREAVIREDLRHIVSGPAGRRFIGRLLKFGLRDDLTFNFGENGYVVTAFNEGKRAMACMIANSIREIIGADALAECEKALASFEARFEDRELSEN